MIKTLFVDDLELEVRWSRRRRTLGLAVDRKGELIVYSPVGVKPSVLEDFVRDKRSWIHRKLAKKEALRQAYPKREYVNGEGFPYLGRHYRLELVDGQDVPLKLNRGRFRLLGSEADRGREHFVRWYAHHAADWITPRVERFAARMGVLPNGIRVRHLGYRWGSCSPQGRLHFHWAIILFPPSVAELVIVHELAHLVHRNHSPAFWRTVRRILPNYKERRAWMTRNGNTWVDAL